MSAEDVQIAAPAARPSGGTVVGVGLDIVDVARVARLLRRLPAAEARLFTAAERAYCRGCSTADEHFAVRFAAKEAVGKALGTGVLDFTEIEVAGGGRPRVRLRGRTAAAAAQRGIGDLQISLTHTATHAAAIAVAVAVDGSGAERSAQGGTVC